MSKSIITVLIFSISLIIIIGFNKLIKIDPDNPYANLQPSPSLSIQELDLIKSFENELENYNDILSDSISSRSLILNHNFNNDKILIDKQILNLSLINSSYPDHGKILNRSKTREKVRTTEGEPVDLFADATAGIIIPYSINVASGGKILLVDKLWDRIIMMDRGIYDGGNVIAYAYPQTSSYTLGFPTDIASAWKRIGTHNGTYRDSITTIYIAENGGNKISRLDYIMRWAYVSNNFTYVGSHIAENSYSVERNSLRPYSLAFHTGIDSDLLTGGADDVMWYSENYPGNSELVSFRPFLGTQLQRFDQLAIYSNPGSSPRNSFDYININPGRISVYRSPDGQRNLLAFVDESVNKLFVLKLNPDGSYTDHPNSIIYTQDFGIIQLKSVLLQCMDNGIKDVTIWAVGDGGNGGCSGGLNCGDVSTLVVKFIGNTPVKVEYLATYWAGVGSPSSFVDIRNIYGLNGTVDLFTIEKWSDQFGIRRYKPGVDIIAESMTNYCYPAEYATYTVKLTNPAKVKFTAQYRPANGQYSNIDIYINNLYTANPTLSLPSGTSQLTVSRIWREGGSGQQSRIAESGSGQYNMTQPEGIKLKAEFIPLDESFGQTNSIHITKEKIADFIDCSSGGGCPYLYTYTVGLEGETPDPYVQDNNLLHRSEFDQNVGNDIEDKYILNTGPTYNVNEGGYLFKIKELDNDHSYFDRFKLTAIDHPFGTKLGITEYGDYVLYFPDITCSPDYAEHNGDDVTDILQYDSLINDGDLLNGDEEDEVNASFCEGEYRLSSRKDIINIFKNSLFFNNILTASRKPVVSRLELIDSMAVIMNPSLNTTRMPDPSPPNKRPAGVVRAYDVTGLFSSGDIEFARRENRSTVIVPVGHDINIDSVEIDWGKDFSLSYLATTPVFYGGYLEHEMSLISAVNSDNIDLADSIKNSNDGSYAGMDNSTEITLKFEEANEPVQEGWVRDYVFITNGRYIKGINRPDVSGSPGYDKSLNIPKEYKLHQNFPNPFNPFTTIKYDLPKEGSVIIKIYDLLGRELLKQAEFKSAGYHEYQFNGFNFSSGVYFYRIETPGFVDTKRMVLLK